MIIRDDGPVSYQPERNPRDGNEIYQDIITQNPDLLEKKYGKTIWIHPKTEMFEVGDGLIGAYALAERVGWDKTNEFYSRNIGRLQRMPFR